MANADDITIAEWEYLQRTLEAATDAVMVAQPGGTLQEVFAVFRGWTEASCLFSGNRFVLELLQATPDELRELNEQEYLGAGRNPEEILKDAEERCRRSVALLMTKDPMDAETYRRLVLFLSEKVARATVEGGFFGIGGIRISTAEKKAIQRIAEALGEENYQVP